VAEASSKAFGAFDASEGAVEGRQGEVSRLASDLDNHAVRESYSRMVPEHGERRRDDLRVLEAEGGMVEEPLDGLGQLSRANAIDASKNPYGFDEDDVRDPDRPGRDEGLGSGELFGVLAREKVHEDVGVSGAHACAEGDPRFPL
jgi:hypothetical protein